MKRLHPWIRRLPGLLACTVFAGLSAGHAQPPSATGAAVRGGAAGDDTVFINGFGEAPNVIRARRGLEISPVSLDLEGLDAELVGIGSYVVNAIGCNACHTYPQFAPGGDPYLGEPKQINPVNYLAGGRPFGPFVSRNITPSGPDNLPAGLSFEEFRDAFTLGVDHRCAPEDPPPCPLLQIMPWPVFGQMSDHDVRAIYEFLSAIPHAEPAP